MLYNLILKIPDILDCLSFHPSLFEDGAVTYERQWPKVVLIMSIGSIEVSGSLILKLNLVLFMWQIPACRKDEADVLSLKCESLLN